MPTPKKKTSRARRGMRRSHDALEIPPMAFDKKLKEYVRPHTAFKAADGAYYYKGRQVLPPKVKKVDSQAQPTPS
ncbi:MAG: 50S ribosomal protein L32 [Bdellovibrionaceae bacterium]|nr:50S ribosomal protein L32 [Pseudobdellovibrionaceae bacterium]MDW8190733.1 50S ribosomal protein L32 [Pseudobdellovibrionaceae bacterium]